MRPEWRIYIYLAGDCTWFHQKLTGFVTTLSKAPLVEVVTQIRWGNADLNEDSQPVRFTFSKSEETTLPDEFTRVFRSVGYGHLEVFAPEFEDVQFTVSRRYRRGPDEWPVYQSGLGVLSVNQRNDEYDWSGYKSNVLRGFELLTEALQGFYEKPPFIGLELSYLDMFPLEGLTPQEFLRRNFKVKPEPPKEFLSASFIDPESASASLSFEMQVNEPKARLTLSLEPEEHEGRGAYSMDTRVLSLLDAVEYTREGIDRWLEAAHRVQQHAFQTLIRPTYKKRLQ